MDRIDPGSHGEIGIEQLQLRFNRGELLDSGVGCIRTGDEMLPVGAMDSESGSGEDDLTPMARPADVVEVEMSEDDVGDIARRYPALTQTVQQSAADIFPIVIRTHPGVDEDHLIAGRDTEPTQRQLQGSV